MSWKFWRRKRRPRLRVVLKVNGLTLWDIDHVNGLAVAAYNGGQVRHEFAARDGHIIEITFEEKKMKTATLEKIGIFLGCVLLLYALLFGHRADAQAQPQVNASAQLTWTLPATTTDGKPLTGADALTKLQVFASPATIPDSTSAAPTAELGPTATSYAYTTVVPNGTTLYFRLRACIQQCGALSNEATKLIRVAIPGVPTGVSVTVTVTVSIATP